MIKEGMIFKNYRDLCKFIGWKICGGSSKMAQLKSLDTICKWHKEGNKIVIDEVFETPVRKKDGRVSNGNKKFEELFEYLNDSGVYLLKDKTDKMYIGSSKNIYDRFVSHNQITEISRSTFLDKDSLEIIVIESTRGIKDREFLYEIEALIIEEGFKAGLNLVNFKMTKTKKEVKSKKVIKVDSQDYDRAIEILKSYNII